MARTHCGPKARLNYSRLVADIGAQPGWFLGDPTLLAPTHPRDASARHVEMMGERDGVLAAAQESAKAGDHQWAAELTTHLVRIDNEDEKGARWARMIAEGKLASEVFSEFIHDVTSNKPRLVESEFEMSVWNRIIDAAEAHNEPGRFTALIGFEYSPFPTGDNMHRVVVFRDNKEKARQVKPFSSFDSQDLEELIDASRVASSSATKLLPTQAVLRPTQALRLALVVP